MPGSTAWSASRDIWRALPIGQTIRAKWWRVEAGDVPRGRDHEEQLLWLYGWWERIDAWISQNRPGEDRPLALTGDT